MQSKHFISILAALLCAVGCSRTPPQEFAFKSGFTELPERHQANISAGLVRLFGTPSHPRLRVVDPDADVGEDEAPELIDHLPEKILRHGARVYNARCAGCHGVSGDGQGPAAAYLVPKPRDYRRGIFKFTSTPYGNKPARQDLVRVIRRGAKGTSMPAFPWMSEEDLDAVIHYVMFLSQRGEVEEYVTFLSDEFGEDEDIEFIEFTDTLETSLSDWQEANDQVVMPQTAEPPYDEVSVTEGRRLFLSQGCSKCHGDDAKGQLEWIDPEFMAAQEKLPEEQREQINFDSWKDPAPAADLTSRLLHGGRRSIDIYRRIYTGIYGTPMPAFKDMFADDPGKIWHLVHYVRHVIEGGDPTAGIASLPDPVAPESEAAPAEDGN